jgi:acyl-CoA synthetase (AMP-forming)/AMP-acid ligase II
MFSSLVDRLQLSVERNFDAEAVVHRGRRVSYGQLWRDVCALGSFLKERGLRREDRVAILLENSPEYIAAYYGTLMAGGVAVALNTATKARDLVNWLTHSDASWLIADALHPELDEVLRSAHPKLQLIGVGSDGPVVNGATSWDAIMASAEGRQVAFDSLEQNSIATIIYTSGTTGRPKGVTLSHRNLVSNVASILAYLNLTPEDRCLNVLPFYYSYGASVLHTHLAVGATLVLQNNLVYLHNVLSEMQAERITGFPGVPSTFALILSRVKLSNYDLRCLRYMTQAGGAMPPARVKRLREELPHVQLFVMYGQTEATARLAYLPPAKLEQKLGSAGISIPDVQLEIRDTQGNQVPRGTTGEIYAHGPNIMAGYWNDPEATGEVISNGWLKTGDIAYMDEDGYIFIQGRENDIIKSGGHRINPNDIEEAIAELAGVGEVVVVGVNDEILGQTIKAVIVPKPGACVDAVAIKAHCLRRLPAYKVPKYIEFNSELPRTASGKVRRFLLASRN